MTSNPADGKLVSRSVLNSNTPRVAAARGRRRDLPTSTLPTITHAERCLISLAGLLHDLPHGPLSHDIEKKTHRYGDGNDTRLRSCYGPYPKHDDCENNPALYVILFDTQRSVLARVLEHHSPNFWQQLRADALMHEHLKSFVDLVPKCHWKGYERALLPTLLFHLLLFEDIDTAKSHTQLMVMKDFEDKPQYWGLGPKDHWAPLHKAWYQPYRHDIVGNTLSADLLDYLARDAKRLARTIHGDRDLAPGRRHRNRTRSRTTGNEQWAAAGTSQPRVAGWLSAEWT